MRTTAVIWAFLAVAFVGVGCGNSGVHDPGDQDGSYQPDGDPIVTHVHLPEQATMEFVWLGPGYFMMGSPDNEEGRFANEGPRHRVTLTRGFHLGRYEITQSQWEAVMNTRPWAHQEYVIDHPDRPAVCISWDDLQGFIARLNEGGTARFRLPTEAEWEYACRAGASSPWWFGDQETDLLGNVWYRANTWDYGFRYGQAIGTMAANPWGLHDLHGNVQEWVHDWYGSYASAASVDPTGPAAGTARVVRGGSVDDEARCTRSAFRSGTSPDARAYFLGARLVMQE